MLIRSSLAPWDHRRALGIGIVKGVWGVRLGVCFGAPHPFPYQKNFQPPLAKDWGTYDSQDLIVALAFR